MISWSYDTGLQLCFMTLHFLLVSLFLAGFRSWLSLHSSQCHDSRRAVLVQGIAFFHAGSDILRSKSLDRDCYNSGDSADALLKSSIWLILSHPPSSSSSVHCGESELDGGDFEPITPSNEDNQLHVLANALKVAEGCLCCCWCSEQKMQLVV